jgi:asparagine synthase (glutamine-hydrolysing)
MCGIAGIISSKEFSVNKESLQKMADALVHRGPNGEGFWLNEKQNIGFAHRRLSIIDLSSQAAQPFHYLHCIIVFNGEIYNYLELKEFLVKKGFVFTTQSDTEVVVAAYLFWGKDCLHQFDGMFAFSIFDNKKNEIFIARDRFGEKPFYYSLNTEANNRFSNFYFASEMKALWAIGIEREMNHQLLLNYLTLGYTSNPTDKSQTFYNNISSLPASHFITINLNTFAFSIEKWYEVVKKNVEGVENIHQTTTSFYDLFKISIQNRLRSDVAVGTSLSGGLDSSSIVATIHQSTQNSQYKHKTFTASFPGFEKDETQYSKQVAAYFSIEQHLTFPNEVDLVNNFQTLMYHQEEPLQSSSVFTQFMVYKLAKEKDITVLLDGQGADEILGGYKKYVHWFLQELLLTNLAKFKQEKALLVTNDFLETWNYKNYLAAMLPKIAAKQLQQKAVHHQNINQFVNKEYLRQFQNTDSLQKPVIKELQDILSYNTNTFGLDELLRYADRNSMAHSREVRLPFLNHQLVEFTASLPSSYKINNGFTKWILRESVKNILPENITWRKGKIGYEPPQKKWMENNKIREMIIESKKKLVDKKILDTSVLQLNINAKNAHDADNFDWRYLCAAQIM